MKKILLSTLLVLPLLCKAQTNAYGSTLSYQNQSGNLLKIGGYYMRVASNSLGVKIDATANIAHSREQWRAIPEAGISVFPNADLLVAPYAESEFTPYTITPKIGFSIIHILDFNIGYGIEVHTPKNSKPIKGISFSMGISIPLNQILD